MPTHQWLPLSAPQWLLAILQQPWPVGLMVLSWLAVLAVEVLLVRQHRRKLHDAIDVDRVSDCHVSRILTRLGELPMLACGLPSQRAHQKRHGNECFRNCRKSVHKDVLKDTTINLSDISSIFAPTSYVVRITIRLLLQSIPTFIALQRILSSSVGN